MSAARDSARVGGEPENTRTILVNRARRRYAPVKPLEDYVTPLLRQVLSQIDGPDPRVNEVVSALVKHLHAFVEEVRADLSCAQGGASPWEEVPLLEPACDECRPMAGPTRSRQARL
ncbi:hypothetical protein ABZW11_11130 [Nonomuraea sp. NPDC004580]|uniref:hypothetical protein n=1 Tax=Nonomuraea sp. NPDC004580 TaxID=3154552 RepID=UPI0033B83B9F